jgi:lipopolysaccharide assembly outer membrane protein LptD (OstA)
MRSLRAIHTLALCVLALPFALNAQQQIPYDIEALNDDGWANYDDATKLFTGTNGVMFRYGDAYGTADTVTMNTETGDVVADGDVRLQREEQVWSSEHIRYNFKTRQMQAQQFRTGKAPVFASGEGLHSDLTNHVLTATNAFITAEDIDNPAVKVRAKRITVIPGQKIIAYHATLRVGEVPIFYFPYYTRNIGPNANNFNFLPGYRSSFGPFVLGSYTFFLNHELSGAIHVDYREKRGFGTGPDLHYNLGRWGQGTFKYYYLYDQDPNESSTNDIPHNRQRINFSYQATPFTNLNVLSVVRYQGDPDVVKEFFEGEYRQNIQPSTFVEVNKFSDNFSVDAYTQPRVNDFLETQERLPDIRLTGYRQQLWTTPFFYESESSGGYYRHLFPETNGPPAGLEYAATRADTYQQIVLPTTFFGWLNFTPRVGGRYTYYSTATGPGATTSQLDREVFNTGAEVSFKASRLWPEAENSAFDVDGLRHIVEPSMNYVYVPNPNHTGTNEIPQFDAELPSLRLLPIEYPDYNSIDSIDSQNVMRFSVRNKLQTKRDGKVVDLVRWDLYTDWRLKPQQGQSTFADVYSDLILRPKSWLTLDSILRYDLQDGLFRMSYNTLTFQPNEIWSWTIGHYYLRDDFSGSPTELGQGNNLITSTLFYRVNENWGLRAAHRYDIDAGKMDEQDYSIYRDLRSWTAALTFRLRNNPGGPEDFTVAFTFSLKAFPRFGLGTDTLRPNSLLGS